MVLICEIIIWISKPHYQMILMHFDICFVCTVSTRIISQTSLYSFVIKNFGCKFVSQNSNLLSYETILIGLR